MTETTANTGKAALEAKVEAFLAKGGEIMQVPTGKSGYKPAEAGKRQSIKLGSAKSAT